MLTIQQIVRRIDMAVCVAVCVSCGQSHEEPQEGPIGCIASSPILWGYGAESPWGFSAKERLEPWLMVRTCQMIVADAGSTAPIMVYGISPGSYTGQISLSCDQGSTSLVTVEKRGGARVNGLDCEPGFVTVACSLAFEYPPGGPTGKLAVIARFLRESSQLILKDDGQPLMTELYSLQYASGFSARGTSLSCDTTQTGGLAGCDILETSVADSTDQTGDASVTTVFGTGFRILTWDCGQ